MLQTAYKNRPCANQPQIRSACLMNRDVHGEVVSWSTFSPDGEEIISGSYDHTLKIWDAADGACLNELSGSVFASDTRAAFSGSNDRRGIVITMDCGIYLRGFSLDGGRLVSASGDGTIKIRDIATS